MEVMKVKVLSVALALLLCGGAYGQSLSVSANAVDCADMGTLNVEMGWAFSKSWSVTAGVKYNPFSFGRGESVSYRRQRTFDAGVRFWPWHCYSGWWVSAKARYQEFSNTGSRSAMPSEGDRVGAGVSGGYSYMLTPFLNLDLGLGLWGGREVYTSYSCPHCGDVVERGSRVFVLPSDIMVAVAFIF